MQAEKIDQAGNSDNQAGSWACLWSSLGLFEKVRLGEPWYGYRQFCQLQLYPLPLQALKGILFQPWLRGSLEGISPERCRSMLGKGAALKKRKVFAHVSLHARSVAKHAATASDVRGEFKSAGFGPSLIDAQLKNL